MKPAVSSLPPLLNPSEAETLATLLRRAIANGQLCLHVASPYPNETDWKRDGWAFNDMHNGNATSGVDWNVEVCEDTTEGADFPDDYPEEFKAGPRPEVSVYVDDDSLAYLSCGQDAKGLERVFELANQAAMVAGGN